MYTVQKSKEFFFKEINTFTQKWCIKLIISDNKDIYNVTKYSVSRKYHSFKLSVHEIIVRKLQFSQNIKQHSCF